MGLVSGNRLNRFWKKGVKPIKDAIGVLTALSTVDKETLVGAINELADGKFDVAKIVASTNITEPGFTMDGKTASEAITELYSNMAHIKTGIIHTGAGSSRYEAIKKAWNDFPSECPFVYKITDNIQYVAIGYVYGEYKYGAVMYISYQGIGVVICLNGDFSLKQL